jgi:hypothetical protein
MSTTLLKIPITETSNELTKDIDGVDSLGIVRLLRQSDAQLFSGYLDLPCVYDEEILRSIEGVIQVCKKVLQMPSKCDLLTFIP